MEALRTKALYAKTLRIEALYTEALHDALDLRLYIEDLRIEAIYKVFTYRYSIYRRSI